MTLLIIFFSFISGSVAAISSLLIFVLLERMNRVWLKRTSQPLPRKILKRGLLLSAGPACLAVFSAIRIFFILRGQDISEFWQLFIFAGAGIYCLLLSTFIFSMFDELNRLYSEHHPKT